MRKSDIVRLIALSVFAATFIAFLPALSNYFVNWDDTTNFVKNPHYRGLGLKQLRWMFTTFHLFHYQPISWLTLGLDYLIWGLHPFGYHLTNLLIHCLNAVQFYFLALCLMVPKWEKTDPPVIAGAAFATLFFSLHPLRVESVAWATERRDVLSAFFYLATLRSYLKALDASPDSPSKNRWFAAALVFYPLSLLSKVNAITLPLVLIVLDFHCLRRPLSHWREKIPFFLMAISAGVVGMFAQASGSALASVHYSLYLSQALYSLTFYFWKTLIPLWLSPWYEQSYLTSQKSVTAAALAIFTITSLLFSMRKRRPELLLAWTCYAVMIFPALGKIQLGRQIVDDRFSYLPCLPLALIAGALLSHGLRRTKKHIPIFVGGAAAAWLIALGGLTWRQSRVWHDDATLWSYAYSIDSNSPLIQTNLAVALIQKGRNEEAITHIDRQLGLSRDPKMIKLLSHIGARARSNIGADLSIQGKTTEAFTQYKLALKLDPNAVQIHNNLGILYYQNGNDSAAAAEFQQALRLDPRFSEAQSNLERAKKRLKIKKS